MEDEGRPVGRQGRIMLAAVTFTTDPETWKIAALFVGSMLGIVLFTFGMMRACVRPRGD